MKNRTDLELMEGLFAYDEGCVSSGIRDDIAKSKLFERFYEESRKTKKIPSVVTEYATYLLSDKGKHQGYTLEDVKEFLEWLDDNGCCI